jgi:uncharacterized protein YbjT (DUF2867 family)
MTGTIFILTEEDRVMKAIVFGASGSAGGSVLRACLSASEVTEVRAISRRPLRVAHDKLHVFMHDNYVNYTPIEETFVNVDACFFCLGISSTQVSADQYRIISYDFPLAAARKLQIHSPAALFHYISGQGTHLKSRFAWARIKGATERDLITLFGAVCWRPSIINGESSESAPRLYKSLRPLFRLLKSFRNLYVDGQDLGRAMIQSTKENVRGRIIENAEIRDIANRYRD